MKKARAFRVSCLTVLLAAICVPGARVLRGQAGAAPQATAPAQQTAAASDALPTFDVVSIKTHKDEGMMMRMGISATPDGFQADGAPLQMLIRQAFGLSEDRILNEPDWAKSARFDINAKVMPEDAPKLKDLSMQQRFKMVLPVLEDRFALKYHHETKELQVYTLVPGKGGPKLKESAPDVGSAGTSQPAARTGSAGGDAPPPPPPPPGLGGAAGGTSASRPGPGGGPPGGPRTMMRMSPEGITLDARGSTMGSLAQMISQQVSATVVDKTGLTGKYDYTLTFMPDSMGMGPMMRLGGGPGADGGGQAQEPVGPSIFAALQEQLGLKLVAEKETVDVVVIDHIEQPSAN